MEARSLWPVHLELGTQFPEATLRRNRQEIKRLRASETAHPAEEAGKLSVAEGSVQQLA